jgi:TRAP-type transport system periplasmic protein
MIQGKRRRFLLFTVCIGLVFMTAAANVSARPVLLKVGSVTPKGSPWDNALRQLAADWNEITDGQVQMRIFSGGVAGEEADVIRKMRFNSLQGAVLTTYGLNQIYQDTFALSLPFLMTSDEEFEYVFNQIEEYLRENIESQGFKVITWTNVGWVYIFAKEKVASPSDLRRINLATTDSDKAIAQALKASNFNAIPVGLSEVLTGLNSGMIDACYTVKMGAAAYQWFGIANHMTDLPMAPVLAAIVVSDRAWRGVPDRYKEEMLEAADDVSRTLATETAKLEKEAMDIMLENGLIVHDVPPETEKQWRTEFEKAVDMIKGQTFSEEVYNRIRKHIDDYRSRYGKN